jgi:hypothetical protein
MHNIWLRRGLTARNSGKFLNSLIAHQTVALNGITLSYCDAIKMLESPHNQAL